MTAPLLNVDAGELEDEPEALYRLAQLVNVACGGHAGDARSMDRVVRIARAAGSRIGAHPSYPDREGFGRRTMAITATALEHALVQQCEALSAVTRALARAEGESVFSVKPHGALYHDANRDLAIARAVVRAARSVYGEWITVIAPPGGALAAAAREAGLAFLREGFADRGVRADGSLIPRGEPGALVTDPAVASARAMELARSGAVDTICVHGDTPGAIDVLAAVREALSGESA